MRAPVPMFNNSGRTAAGAPVAAPTPASVGSTAASGTVDPAGDTPRLFRSKTVATVLVIKSATFKSLKLFQRVFPFIAGMADETFDIIAAIALLNGVDFTVREKLLIILSTYSGVFIEFIVLIGKIQSRFATSKRIERGQCAGVRCLGLFVIIEAVGMLFECGVGLYLLFTIIGDNTDQTFFYTCVGIYAAIGIAGICSLPWIIRYTTVSHKAQEAIYRQ